MKRTSLKFIYKTCLVGLAITTFSCKKVFDLPAKNQVDAVNAYQNVFDANAAVVGIYGKFLGLADRYIVLNELRADLVSPTVNADTYLKQLNTHTETTDNPWADPKPWYSLILNCNDAMYHFDDMLKTGKLKPVDYQQRYSDIGALRCWLYLQVAIQYGTIPYVTDPVSNLTDLNDATKFPRLTLDQVIDKLATFMNDPVRYLDTYSTTDPITASASSSLNATVDGQTTSLFFINKYALKGDINLWKGDFKTASTAYRTISDIGPITSNNNAADFTTYEQFKACYDNMNVSYGNPSSNPNPNQTENPLNDNNVTGWRQMFADPTISTNSRSELIWRLPFSSTFAPVNPFIDLFANQGGSYKLTVSQAMMDNWNSQVQNNGYPYDARSRVAVRTIGGQPVIMKQLYYYLDNTSFLPVNVLQKPGYWLLYRSGVLANRFAESATNDNQLKLGYALLNIGVGNVFAPTPLPSDRTNTMQTFLPAPYDMDGRSGGPQNYHGIWYRQVGTRSRANLVPLPASTYNDKITLENAILDEAARETSFEGFRWGDLVRVAHRRGTPAYLADKVYNKLVKENNPAAVSVRAKLMTEAGWYMPFKL
ncbi:RagB/SusD family nutrient uptake outer membrane protein [Mucilaginibacter mali]|uniref:RagB/SusD family nutrient uptake outer membrane protein n=1 Tax=Mucilaginibacter mali TaxID=2740462 RepID=A0A7D4QA09_9SPHI|nr:RagB/SusD family nutrient uptake outer membrane protein [Mucilaginibacter mali]QKJ29764.1 RagB/SusD family nutrient uptake outer membrane protein [Mucilaginibacter mali]